MTKDTEGSEAGYFSEASVDSLVIPLYYARPHIIYKFFSGTKEYFLKKLSLHLENNQSVVFEKNSFIFKENGASYTYDKYEVGNYGSRTLYKTAIDKY